MAQLVKTIGGLAIASVKTLGGLAIASVKTVAGLDNTSGGGGGGPFVAVQNTNNTTSGQTVSTVSSISTSAITGVGAGHAILAWVKHEGAPTTITVSDGTTSFSPGTKTNHSNGDFSGQWFYLPSSVASGTVTYTASFSVAKPFCSIIVWEYSYTGTASLDTEATNQSNGSTAVTSTNLTTSATNTVVLGGYGEYSPELLSAALVNGSAANTLMQLASSSVSGAWARIMSGTFTGAATATLSGGGTDDWICNAIALKTS